MAKIDIISLSGNTFKNIGTDGVLSIIAANVDSEDITLDLIIGSKTLHGKTSDTNAAYILKAIPIPVGASFVWDGDNILNTAFKTGALIRMYQDTRGVFTKLKDNTFLIRLGSGHVGDVLMRRS